MSTRTLSPANHPHLGGFALLPPKEGTCPLCAVKHEMKQPHNQQSLFWQYDFYGKNGRWPTWKDAMAHCDEATQKHWITELTRLGVKTE